MPRFEPDVFGKYFLLQRIAVGGMAEVVRAKTLGAGGFQKELVVKRILPALAKDQHFIGMFVNEAKITVGLSHPNIAQIFELGEIRGSYFMAMELVDGVQLRELVPLFRGEQPRLGIEHAVWTAFEALKGLDHAHRSSDAVGQPLGIVHCDISPDNIMVTFDAGVKVVDFGIARAATGISNARAGMVMGKVNYLSPEQATGQEVDARTDVYAMGVVLYHLLSGAYPYGRFERLDDLVPLVRGELPYIPLSEHNPRLPAELDEVIGRAVAIRPEDRYEDASWFMMACEELLYPTPLSAISQHLRAEIGRSFALQRDRLSRLRANDETVMRILARRAEDRPAESSRPDSGQIEALGQRTPPRERAAVVAAIPAPKGTAWKPTRVQLVLSLLAAVVLFATAEAIRGWLAPGVLVVTSTPSGATVTLNGKAAAGVTPLVVQDVRRQRRYVVAVSHSGHRPWTGTVEGDGETVRMVDARLRRATGDIHVDSQPQGAQVYLDDRLVGRTPMVLPDVDLMVPHKIGLEHKGYELDEVVLQDVAPGHRLRRELQRRTK